MRRSLMSCLGLSLLTLLPACSTEQDAADEDSFVAGEELTGKFDTGYVTSLDAAEVEVDIEGDVSAPSYSLERAPLDVGQFALTFLRKSNGLYIQSLAEDYSHGTDQIEWLVGRDWKKWSDIAATSRTGLSHFRMRAVSAIVMHPGDRAALVGKTYSPTVPKKPTTLFADVGDKCGEEEGGIHPDQDVYWYVWSPSLRTCTAEKTTAKVTITKVLPAGATVRPEYDRLVADKKIDVLVIFGQVDHGAIDDSDYAFSLIRSFESSLKAAGFKKGTAELGLRYTRTRAGLAETIDIYSPREFAGLGDVGHFANFDKGLNSHEIVVYNGHSMLGASDFWARKSIYMDPTRYQIFLYNGCLGYQYYVNPILEGKQGWDNVDIVSNITETPFAIMVQETSNAVSMIMAGAERGGTTTWKQILTRMNQLAGGDAFYGASGVRTNKFTR